MRHSIAIRSALVGALAAASACTTDSAAPPNILSPTVSPSVGASRAYTVTQSQLQTLGTCGGRPGGQALDINQHGVVVGWSCLTASGAGTVTLWQADGTPQDLEIEGVGLGISENGTVVGALTADPQTFVEKLTFRTGGVRDGRPFRWTKRGGLVVLPTLGGNTGYATKVNARGTVVGVSETATGELHGFRWSQSSGIEDLGPMVEANDISQGGAIAGAVGTHAVLRRQNGSVIDYGLRGTGATATAIRSSGVALAGTYFVAGTSQPEFESQRAFISDEPGVLVDVPTLGGTANAAFDINEKSEVVGWSWFDVPPGFPPGEDVEAFFWSRGTGVIRLDKDPVCCGFVQSVAFALNTRGQIVGYNMPFDFVAPVMWTVKSR